MTNPAVPTRNDSAIIWGADAIGREINMSSRATYHLLEKKRLPARKIGKRWVAHRDRLHAHLSGEVSHVVA